MKGFAGRAVKDRAAGTAFPAPDGRLAAIGVCKGFAVATREASASHAVGVEVPDPWKSER